MAQNIQDLIVKLKAEGFENIDKLRGSFRELNRVTGFTETELGKLRKEILSFDTGVGKTTQSIKGQVDALRALQGQAAINGTIYNKLGKDLKTLGGAYQEAATGAKKFTDAQLATQFVGAKPATFDPQIAALRRGLRDLSVYGSEYTDQLTEIQRREQAFGTATSRQGVIAAFEAYAQGPIGPGAKGTAPKLPELPDTTAALRQRLSELSKELDNVTRGGEDWVRVSRELVQVQKELGRTIETPEIQAIRARIQANRGVSSGFRAFSYRAGQVETRSRAEADAAFVQSLAQYKKPIELEQPSALFRSIGSITDQAEANRRQLMKRSYTDVAASIREASAASDGSLNSLRAQRTAWENLRNTLGDNKTALREVDKELRNVDKQLERRTLGRRGLTAGQAVQAGGAIISGGIFGGPEGFLGGLGGAALGSAIPGLGTVGGAFAGSAIGAQVGMFRQQLGDLTEYSSRIDKLQISLRGIVGSQDAYNTVLASAARMTKDLNIPQETAIQGLTRLSAAVLGAGGNVNDSTFAFGAIAKAIKATGGSAEEADGALLALTQVFSKGKVSAEELNQIAERLPGTFTVFAKATGRTGPELLKALQNGQVGLNDLMKFLGTIDTQYGQTALRVAASTQDAGARMTVAMDAVKYNVGRALQPIGAQIQDAFTKALQNATPALIEFAKVLTTTFKILVDNGPLITTSLSALLGFGAVAGTIAGITKLGAVISTVTAFFVEFGGAASVATLAIESLGIAIASVPGIGWIAGGITALGLLTAALYNNNTTFKTWANNIGTIISSDFKNSMQNMVNLVAAGSKKVSDLWNWLRDTTRKTANSISTAFGSPFGFIADAAQKAFGAVQRAIAQMWNGIPAPIRKALGQGAIQALGPVGYAASVAVRASNMPPQTSSSRGKEEANPPIPTPSLDFTTFPSLTNKDTASASQKSLLNKLQSDFDRTLSLLGRQFNVASRNKLLEDSFKLENDITKALKQGNLEEVDRLKTEQRRSVLKVTQSVLISETEKLEQQIADGQAKRLNTDSAQVRLDEVRNELKQTNLDIAKLENEELQKQIKSISDINAQLRETFGPQRLGIFGEIPQQFTFDRNATFMPDIKTQPEEVKRIAEDLQKLNTPLAQLTSAAEAIGSAFSNAFTSIVSGSATAQQSLATLFTNISNYFLDMAGKIIAKWIEMAVLNTVLSLFPTGIGKLGVGSSSLNLPGLEGAGALAGGGGLSTDAVNFSPEFLKGLNLNRLGAAYASNGIVPFAMGGAFQRGITPYAMGGIVSRPTFFAYANGGVPGTGLMGEAGPEAVVPLRRLPSGKLGVGSTGGGSTNVTVNVDATGSSVQGDSTQGAALGRAIAAAVQTELVNQKRRGGLLNS